MKYENAHLALEQCQAGLGDKLQDAVATHHFNNRTSQTYQHWIVRYLSYNKFRNPSKLSEKNVRDFLNHLAQKSRLSRARLNQAKEALIFLYNQVLKHPIAFDQQIQAIPA